MSEIIFTKRSRRLCAGEKFASATISNRRGEFAVFEFEKLLQYDFVSAVDGAKTILVRGDAVQLCARFTRDRVYYSESIRKFGARYIYTLCRMNNTAVEYVLVRKNDGSGRIPPRK